MKRRMNLYDKGAFMSERPDLNKALDVENFLQFYWLKEELVDFCRKNGLQTTGGKAELTERIALFLSTGERAKKIHKTKRNKFPDIITLDTKIEENFVCSEKHRKFYKEHISSGFTFNVAFQKWLKNNGGKTYRDSIDAYYTILENKKKTKTVIDSQFEYNTYIRDFFADNKGKSLEQAIRCWKYKKSLKGHNKYEKEDLKILDEQ